MVGERCEPMIEKYRRAVETQQTLEEEADDLLPESRSIWMHSQIVPFGVCVAITLRDISEPQMAAAASGRADHPGCAMRIWLWRHSNSNWRSKRRLEVQNSTSLRGDMNDRLVLNWQIRSSTIPRKRVVSMTLCKSSSMR